MFAVVADLFKMEIGQNFKLLAGKNGLNKSISWTYVCQENEISPWVNGHELLILYGAGINRDEKSLLKIVKQCAQKQLSGIIVLVGYFITEIPEKMIKCADEYNIPLIEMPYDIPITKLTKEIGNLILQQNNHLRRIEDIICDIIYGYEDNTTKLINELQEFGYYWDRYNYIVIVSLDKDLTSRIREVSAIVSKNLGTVINFIQSNKIIMLVGGYKSESAERVKMICQDSLSDIFGEKQLNSVDFVVGSNSRTATQLKVSYTDCLHLLSAKKCFSNLDFSSYNEMPIILKLLFELKNDVVPKHCYKSVLGKLLEYDSKHDNDLIGTLETYLLSNGNITESAEKLFIHRNTMNYRLKQISELTSRDLSNASDKFELLCAIFIYKHVKFNNGK